MSLDVMFLAWNRKEFTEFSFNMLLENTNWDLVRQLVVYDDGSEDGTAELLFELIHKTPVEYHLVQTERVGPVGVMNHYVESSDSEVFAKVDNDIVVPPGWLDRLDSVMTLSEYRDYDNSALPLEALGMEAGRMGANEDPRGFQEARWIGGVGLIRTEALGGRPRMVANGRYGWTEFQQEYGLRCGWVCPDLMVSSLDQVPFEPWASLATSYCTVGWSRDREWPKYHERWMEKYWGWWHGEETETAA